MVRLLWSDEPMPVNVGNPREMTITDFPKPCWLLLAPIAKAKPFTFNPKKSASPTTHSAADPTLRARARF